MRIATGALRPRNGRGFTRGAVGGGTHGSRPTAEHFVGQGPCALPGVQHKTDGRTEASTPTDALQEVRASGIRIVKTLMEKGKGMHDIDVLGLNKNNQVIAAQVSYTDNVSTIKGKYKSLLNYKYADKYILCTLKNKEEVSTFMNIDNDNLTIISLNDIWKDFNNSRMK